MHVAVDYYPLNLRQDLPDSNENKIIKNQYFHVARGIHHETITDFLSFNNIKFSHQEAK